MAKIKPTMKICMTTLANWIMRQTDAAYVKSENTLTYFYNKESKTPFEKGNDEHRMTLDLDSQCQLINELEFSSNTKEAIFKYINPDIHFTTLECSSKNNKLKVNFVPHGECCVHRYEAETVYIDGYASDTDNVLQNILDISASKIKEFAKSNVNVDVKLSILTDIDFSHFFV